MLNYDYTASRAYCAQIGLIWLGDDFQGLVNMDTEAKSMGLFTPQNYGWRGRLGLAVYFLTGWKPKS